MWNNVMVFTQNGILLSTFLNFILFGYLERMVTVTSNVLM